MLILNKLLSFRFGIRARSMARAAVPTVAFNNGRKHPILGLGTFQAQPGEVTQAVKDAIDAGYRHIDCAHIYRNEREVGLALADKIKEGVIQREDMFITSKLWNTFHRRDLVEPAIKTTLSNLGLDYLDLYLIHWPQGFKEGGELIPKDESGKIVYSETSFTETWKGLEECVRSGFTRSIGLSNFNSQQMKQILSIASIKPVTNQVECHVYLNQRKLLEACRSEGVVLTGYAPLGSPARPSESDLPSPLLDPVVASLAARYNKTPAQILIKFQVQRGVICIPKSVTKERIISNIDIFDFELSEQDMGELEALDRNGRFFLLKGISDHKDFPFRIEF